MVIRFEKTMISTKCDGNRFPIIVLASDEILVQHIILYILRCRRVVVLKKITRFNAARERAGAGDRKINSLTDHPYTGGYTSAIPNYTKLWILSLKKVQEVLHFTVCLSFLTRFVLVSLVLSFTQWFLFHLLFCHSAHFVLPCYGLVYTLLDHNWTSCLWELDKSDFRAVTKPSNRFINWQNSSKLVENRLRV